MTSFFHSIFEKVGWRKLAIEIIEAAYTRVRANVLLAVPKSGGLVE